jgi:hypothetical protein
MTVHAEKLSAALHKLVDFTVGDHQGGNRDQLLADIDDALGVKPDEDQPEEAPAEETPKKK